MDAEKAVQELPLPLPPPLPPPSPARIPVELQAVFLKAQQGQHELCSAPPNLLAASTWQHSTQLRQRKLRRRFGSSASISSMASSGSSVGSSTEAKSKSNGTARMIGRRNGAAVVVPSSSSATASKTVQLSPQLYLDALVRSRGYCTRRFRSLQTAYFNDPTPLQQASYHVHLIELVRRHDLDAFKLVMQSGAVSPNPCNRFGESLLHTVCRRGDARFLQVLLQNGASLEVCDDRGRTPLHDACWVPSPHFDVVDLILERDPRLLFVVDCRGAPPLQYVPKKDWQAWVQFLEGRKNAYWPSRNLTLDGAQSPTPLALLEPNTRPVPDPPRSLGPDHARRVASGQETALTVSAVNDDCVGTTMNGGRRDGSESASAAAMIAFSRSIVTLRHAQSLGSLFPSQGGRAAETGAIIAPSTSSTTGSIIISMEDSDYNTVDVRAMMVTEPEENDAPSSTHGPGPMRTFTKSSSDDTSSSSCSSEEEGSMSSSDDGDDDSSIDERDDHLLEEMVTHLARHRRRQYPPAGPT